jgi:dipeptidyl aminopeptidase/acylaminoacyl peptidase
MITFLPRVAYWVSRGWNVLVPDHRGSTGHGRTFQQALDQRWGDADVDDVAAAIRLVHQQGIGTPHRTVMMGGSAGGYVALRLVERFPELVAGAAVAYPVSDPTSLFEATHRFEAHYDHSLVGPNTRPVDPALVRRPILILHGDSDPVVPLDQSIRFADRMRAAGGDIALHVYEGEGHGFRQPANQRDEFDRIGGFVHRLIG